MTLRALRPSARGRDAAVAVVACVHAFVHSGGCRCGGRVESLRFVVCAQAVCAQVFFLCRRCDRGQRYCTRACAARARWTTLRSAGARYQRSRAGRFRHAARQHGYRTRRRAQQKVTHHSPRAVPHSGMVRFASTARASTVRRPAGAEEATDAWDLDAGRDGPRWCPVVRRAGPRCARCGQAGGFVRHHTLARDRHDAPPVPTRRARRRRPRAPTP